MIDKELILAEIERRLQYSRSLKIDSDYYNAQVIAYEELIDFINSLPEEPDLNWKDMSLQERKDLITSLQKDIEEPVSNGLEEELDKYIQDNFTIEDEEVYKKYGVEPKDYMYSMDKGDMLKMLRHFQRREEPVSEDLEEAASKYCEGSSFEDAVMKKPAFKAGAKWQKEQFEKNRLKHCNSITNEQAELEQGFIDQHLDKYNRMPTFLDAIEYGMKLQEQKDDKDESYMLVIAHMDGVERGKAIMKQQMMKGAFIPGFKSIEFKLGEEYTFNSKNFDMEKAKAYGAKEGDTIIGYFIKKED